MKKRLLFIMPTLNYGGAEKVFIDMVNMLDPSKYLITLFLIKNDGKLINKLNSTVKIVYGLEKEMNIKKNIVKLLKKLINISKQSDVLIGFLELVPTYLAIITSKIVKKPSIGWVHTDINEFLKGKSIIHKILVVSLYPFLTKLVTVSYSAKESLNKLLKHSHIEVIYNPINIHEIQRLSLEPLGNKLKKDSILSVGRLVREKGIDILIKAHANLIKEGFECHLYIIGDGPEKNNLKNIVNNMNTVEYVHFLGFKDNPYKYMKRCNVFVLPSRFEGFSLVLAESLALNKKIIAANCKSGPSEILMDGKYGKLVEPENIQELSIALREVLTNGKDLMDGNERIERANEFDVPVFVKKFDQLLEEVII